MTKKQERELLYNKYNGRCAYCGDPLKKGWHVDEIEPIKRYTERIPDGKGSFLRNSKGNYKLKYLMENPEKLHIDNQNPSCPSCNIQKNSYTLEQFRENIKNFVNSLNQYSTQYKFAKKYGLIEETGIEVKFYFETL